MRRRKCKRNGTTAANRQAEYRILLFKDVEQVPVQLKVPFKRVRLAAAAGLSVVFLFLVLALGLFINVRIVKESEIVHRQLTNSSEQKIQEMQRENEALKENLKRSDEQLQEIREMQDIAASTRQKLEDIEQREQEVRSKLGLDESDSEASVLNKDVMKMDIGQSQASITPQTIPMLRQTYSSLQEQLDTTLSDFSTFSDIITKKEEDAQRAADIRAGVVSYALQFLGGAYVYGGNDPNNAVDCSGFTRYVLSHAAGVNLNRTAAAQSAQGTTVTINQIKPGDLIFYGDSNSNIDHVALYIGDGKVVHASTAKSGIIVSRWDYRTPVKMKNVLGQ